MRRILITGSTRGLGAALTDELVGLGHRVAGCGTSAEKVAAQAARHAAPHHFSAVDVSDDAAVAQWAATLLGDWGVPDLIFNNAALINSPAPLWEVPVEELSRLVDVNVKGVVNVIRHFVPAMAKSRRGVIVNLSSGWGRSTAPGVAPYCASKWAIEGLSRALAQELPDGMAAVALNPGVIHTEMLEVAFGRDGAAQCVSPTDWSRTAAPFLLQLGANDNGRALTAP